MLRHESQSPLVSRTGGQNMLRWAIAIGLLGSALAGSAAQLWFAPYGAHVWPWGAKSSDFWFLLFLLICGFAAVLGGMSGVLGVRALRTASNRLGPATTILLGLLPFLIFALVLIQERYMQSLRDAEDERGVREMCEQYVLNPSTPPGYFSDELVANCRKALGR